MCNTLRTSLKRAVLIVTLPTMIMAFTATNAQSDEEIPECDSSQVSLIILEMQNFMSEYISLNERIANIEAETLPQLTEDLSDLQLQWWGEITPALPRCTLAIRVSFILGRMLDESLITLALGQAQYPDLVDQHIAETERLSPNAALLVSLFLDTEAATTAQPAETTYRITASNAVNGRDCPRTSCSIVTRFEPGSEIFVIETVEGEGVSGNIDWLHVNYNGRSAYVHSSLAAPG
jgi:hypothetical protein